MIRTGLLAPFGRRLGRVIALLFLAASPLVAAPAADNAARAADESPGADSAGSSICAPDLVDLRGTSQAVRYRIEVADTPDSRARGLMFRSELAADAGMLFLFDPPRPVSFWMRNTPLPLDLLFIDEGGVVRSITRNAVPYSEKLMPSGGVVRAVLEVNAGQSKAHGLIEGAEVRHPAFGQAAVWPCP